SDLSCGGDGDNCVAVGGSNRCGKACAGPADCPQYYGCQMVTSVDGAAAKQCLPLSGSCGTTVPPRRPRATPGAKRAPAPAAPPPPLEVATEYREQSCPDGSGGTNPDWYRIDLIEDSDITVTLAGGAASDLDLQLTDNQGVALATSNGPTSAESV